MIQTYNNDEIDCITLKRRQTCHWTSRRLARNYDFHKDVLVPDSTKCKLFSATCSNMSDYYAQFADDKRSANVVLDI